ncbi:MAG TPA: malto-oligosyltrehalose synthase [Candidatus Sulfotelmatobacter sp.]
MPPSRIPSATYRLQLNKDFRFSDACGILDYLQTLGISDVYLSPILAARKGSGHGYDVVDPTRINPELGTEEEFEHLQAELQKRGMGLVLDIVPNHMAASVENSWWMDTLENGTESAYAAFFDIDWHPSARSLDGKILLPVLGRPFGQALDAGELKLAFQEGKFYLQYFDSSFPIAPRSYFEILNRANDSLKAALGEDSAVYQEYLGIRASLRGLSNAERRSDTVGERRQVFGAARDRLWSLVKANAEVNRLIDETLQRLNGVANDPASVGHLQRLIAEQNYKLSYWQNVNESINYRRFFTIADLVGVRVEDPVVFDATHNYLLRVISKGPFTGLRVDHIDGLRDPLAYLNKLQERLAPAQSGSGSAHCYLIVEKILARNEWLPGDWPVDGTTGYEYLNYANGVSVNPDGAIRLAQIYAQFTGSRQKFVDVLYEKKKLVMRTLLAVEIRSLGRQLAELASQDRYARELPRPQLIEALTEVTAGLSIYRTYIRNLEIPDAAAQCLAEAIQSARQRAPRIDSACFDFVQEVLLLQNPSHVLPGQREARLAFVTRWQQFTGPIVAKGMEDTALYVYYPLLSLNEVGGTPEPSDVSTREGFFSFLEERNKHWPHCLNATTTHDTKRSEGVRGRINVLSEIPDEWQQHLLRWVALNKRHVTNLDGRPAPDRNEEYFLYQTLLGAWPLEAEAQATLPQRLQQHLIKATREAMVHTRWTRPNEQHEKALQEFISKTLSSEGEEFLRDFRPFQKQIAFYGMLNSIAQVLTKITVPGVPDFYQGSELWDFRLVDPDNRGTVDFRRRTEMLQTLQAHNSGSEELIADLTTNWHDGQLKLYLIQRALRWRREHSTFFQEAEFLPLQVTGECSDNVVAFMRRYEDKEVVIAVPRWVSRLGSAQTTPKSWQSGFRFDWRDTRIVLPSDSAHDWQSVLNDKPLRAGAESGNLSLEADSLFRDIPVAFLHAG